MTPSRGSREQDSIRIDRDEASRVLKAAVSASRSEELASEHPWVKRVTALWEACKGTNKTMIPILGTAILARAVDLRIDPFALQSQSGPTGFDARGLCTEVLAAQAREHGIDLGVRSREPHNSQPFCFEPRVGLHMKAKSKPALALLVEALDALARTRTKAEAEEVLQAFVQVRVLKRLKVQVLAGEGDHLEERDLVALIQRFVGQDSESGNRPQVVVAGLMDVLFKPELVAVGNPNDPTPHAAGDVRVYTTPSKKEAAFGFEVRYKYVDLQELGLVVEGLKQKTIQNFGVIAVADDQEVFDPVPEIRHAKKLGIRLSVFFGWHHLVTYCLFFSSQPGPVIGHAYRAILARMDEQGVSDDGINLWREAKGI